jgi:hypothetical protein
MNAAAQPRARNRHAIELGLPSHVPDGRNVALAVVVAHEFLDRPLWPTRLDGIDRDRAEILLSVLTYCYAKGSLRSDEVERLVAENAAVEWLASGGAITADEVRIFRQRHFSLVASCLTEFVLRSAVLHPGEAFASEANRLRRAIAEKHANERLTVAALNDTATV